jgi:hypothetical protein
MDEKKEKTNESPLVVKRDYINAPATSDDLEFLRRLPLSNEDIIKLIASLPDRPDDPDDRDDRASLREPQ